jgi:hypothetical protein
MDIFQRGQNSERVKKLEEDVRKERGALAQTIVNFDRTDNPLNILVRQHLELLHRGQ